MFKNTTWLRCVFQFFVQHRFQYSLNIWTSKELNQLSVAKITTKRHFFWYIIGFITFQVNLVELTSSWKSRNISLKSCVNWSKTRLFKSFFKRRSYLSKIYCVWKIQRFKRWLGQTWLGAFQIWRKSIFLRIWEKDWTAFKKCFNFFEIYKNWW